jgi:hypothetical protein
VVHCITRSSAVTSWPSLRSRSLYPHMAIPFHPLSTSFCTNCVATTTPEGAGGCFFLSIFALALSMLESLDSAWSAAWIAFLAWSAAWIAFLSRYRGVSLMQSPLSVTSCTPQSICSDLAAVQRKSGMTSRFRRRASAFREPALFLCRRPPTGGYTSRVPNLLNFPPCRVKPRLVLHFSQRNSGRSFLLFLLSRLSAASTKRAPRRHAMSSRA